MHQKIILCFFPCYSLFFLLESGSEFLIGFPPPFILLFGSVFFLILFFFPPFFFFGISHILFLILFVIPVPFHFSLFGIMLPPLFFFYPRVTSTKEIKEHIIIGPNTTPLQARRSSAKDWSVRKSSQNTTAECAQHTPETFCSTSPWTLYDPFLI